MKPINSTLIAAIFIALPLFSGCVCMPPVSVTEQIGVEELSQHVDFLTQRSLKGRPAGSWESAHVRKYLSQRLQAYGCVPWADNPSFELDFGFGKNIIAVLPGSDPQLAGEIVLVSAHYDHLRPGWFKWYPGACDNAAAVAVLLEIAEKISRRPIRPKRSICFAFFDAEEMGCVGSYAFTDRDDYDDDAIVAALNMDLLGRDLLDVVDHCLIATGTEHYADLQQVVHTACADNGLQCVPLDADLIGPVGDHTAFTSDRRPVLFFSCGINKDYHQPTDTPDKLNYSKLKKEAAAIEQTLLALANGDKPLLAASPVPPTAATLEPFSYILHKFKDHQDLFKLDPNGIETLDTLIAQTAATDPNRLRRNELVDLQRKALGKLISLLKHYNKDLAQQSDGFISISELYAKHPKGFSDAYRQFIRHYLKNKPSLFRKNKFDYDAALPMIDADWGIVKTDDGVYLFAALQSRLTCSTELSLTRGFEGSIECSYRPVECKGSLNEIIDLICLEMNLRGLKGRTISDSFSFGRNEDTQPDDDLWRSLSTREKASQFLPVLKAIKQKYPQEKLKMSLKEYYDPNEPQESIHTWLLALAKSNNHYLAIPALEAGVDNGIDPIEGLLSDFISDTTKPDAIRLSILNRFAEISTPEALGHLVDSLDDQTPYDVRDYLLLNDPNYPLKDHPTMKEAIPEIMKYYEKAETLTFSQHALKKLKEITQKDFGTDKEAWKKWIEKHYQ